MSFYKVGIGDDAWDFKEAYKKANNGDTIEFEPNYALEQSYITSLNIAKSLNFIGNIESKSDGEQLFTNAIRVPILVTGGAKVTFTDLWIDRVYKDCIAIHILNRSSVTLRNCIVNAVNNSQKNLIISGKSGSNLTMIDCATYPQNSDFQKYINLIDSKGTFSNSTFYSNLWFVGSKVDISNCIMINYGGSVVRPRSSNLTIRQSRIEGGSKEGYYPALIINNSSVTVDSSSIIQEMKNGESFTESVCSRDGSNLNFSDSFVSSIFTYDSKLFLNSLEISYILSLNDSSLARIQQCVNFQGNNNEKIDLLVRNNSALIADEIKINRLFDPNIRVKQGSHLYINQLDYVYGSASDLFLEADETSYFNLLAEKQELTEEKQVPQNPGKVERNPQNSMEKLNNLVGLTKVKEEIHKMIRMVEFNKHRIAKGLKPQKVVLHSVFMGNPGTGKTTLARILGEVLFDYGIFKGDELKFIEVKEADLISGYVGQTAIQTQNILDQAKGGILFIDEAYTLNKKDANVNFGQEAINTLLTFMEDNREDTMIIFAGYTKEMEQFLKTNPGLKSRVPNTFLFEDYTADEIIAMGEKQLKANDYILEDSDYYKRNVSRVYNASLDRSNGRWIRNFNEKLYKALADRCYKNEQFEDLNTITNQDIDEVLGKHVGYEVKTGKDAFDSLNELIGLSKVKQQISDFVHLAELNRRREEENGGEAKFTLHSLFLGNPGTGKTTVARILGEIFYQKGIIAQKKFIEVSRSDLVAGYVGQTALKTREVLESALGGVLFIDEAYSLANSNDNFGQEAINEILKFMEDHRQDIIIVLAGYTKEMNAFLSTNSGLTSRIPNVFDFEDYSEDEIVEIGHLGLSKQSYKFNESLYGEVIKKAYAGSNDHSNGRWIRNVNERLIKHLSSRVANDPHADINQITDEDILKLLED
ncbi:MULTISPECIES: AAA family ATPase [Aerococcus]|uniref:AAA family ATPase n=1 Tax=Aerococcus TaxID=1375 RepID=UPI00209F2F31|nr:MULTISPECIES: AAA family ATPase [Aerococcus]MDK6292289.1 AAA family ATPase [Aerococcus urinae]MDK8388037.1 AAA family ATPase [Aerococcus urinae]MDL5183499.1 AAA family ATPase [Aerococcus mictus]WIW74198.1 AAA family ATPase [Aerococcus tenax]